MHHAFWRYMDPAHHRHVPGSPLASAIHDYYVMIDREVGELLECIDNATTAIWVVSDHGARRMDGGFCINDWLVQRGLLVLRQPPPGVQPFRPTDVDWRRTKVWGEGGYYGRCFINLQGREPQGIVPRGEYENLRNELIRKLEALPDDKGRPIGTRVYKPEAIYRRITGVAPDLIAIFGDLHWRSVGTVGNQSIYTFKNDTGPDDANHAQQGMYILALPHGGPRGRIDGPTLYDIAPTILKLLGQRIPADMIGQPLV
jgi:predicted AlkP superfamily phosphohydrolase/phosphomutase